MDMSSFHSNVILAAKLISGCWDNSFKRNRRPSFSPVKNLRLSPFGSTTVKEIEFEITALFAEVDALNSNKRMLPRLPQPQANSDSAQIVLMTQRAQFLQTTYLSDSRF